MEESKKITRMSASGNSFFIIESEKFEKKFLLTVEKQKFVQALCEGFPGMSTDGVLFLDKNKNLNLLDPENEWNFQWDFYNSDGSKARMCGNAARCATLYCLKKESPGELEANEVLFKTEAGIIFGEILDSKQNIVRVSMPEVKVIASNFEVLLQLPQGSKKIQGSFLDTGVPHFVIEENPDENLAKALRRVKNFGAEGANITFVDFEGSDFIQAVTFERGVEDFTLACGTGAVAAATVSKLKNKKETEPYKIEMPGGLMLVQFEGEETFLIGPAEFHFELQLSNN